MIDKDVIERTKEKVRNDYQQLLGRLIYVTEFSAYVGDTDLMEDVQLEKPALMKVCPTEDAQLTRICDVWMDPTYELECVELETRPELRKYRTISCYGTSYNMQNGDVQYPRFVAVQAPPSQTGIDLATGHSVSGAAMAKVSPSSGAVNFVQIDGVALSDSARERFRTAAIGRSESIAEAVAALTDAQIDVYLSTTTWEDHPPLIREFFEGVARDH